MPASKFADEAKELATLLRRRSDTRDALEDARSLKRLGNKAHHAAERLCNDETYSNDLYDAEIARVRDSANEIARWYDLKVTISGDPRGFCLHLHGEGVRGNTWGGDESGYGV